eukprot:tig00021433_g21287.t2
MIKVDIKYIKLGRAGPEQRREALAALLPPGHRLLPAPGLPARSAPPGSDASDELVVRHEIYEWAHRWALAHGAGHVLQVLRIAHDSPVDGDKDLPSAEDARMLKIYEQILEVYGKPTKFIRLATPDSQAQHPDTATLIRALERVVADGAPAECEFVKLCYEGYEPLPEKLEDLVNLFPQALPAKARARARARVGAARAAVAERAREHERAAAAAAERERARERERAAAAERERAAAERERAAAEREARGRPGVMRRISPLEAMRKRRDKRAFVREHWHDPETLQRDECAELRVLGYVLAFLNAYFA